MRRPLIGLVFVSALGCGIVFRQSGIAAQSVPQNQNVGQQPVAGQTVGQRFKNIQVLTDMKDAPASELYSTMQFISGSLSVSCNYCHVSQQGPFESDAKRTKLIARDMIKMMRAINQSNFDGRPVITCNTCHRGSTHPNGTPVPWYKQPEEIAAYNKAMQPNKSATAGPEPPAALTATALPDADQVLANYRKIVGAASLKSIRVSGTNVVAMSGNVSFEAYALLPDKILVNATNHQGVEVQTILNGDHGWRLTPQGKAPLPPSGIRDIRARFEYLLLPVKYEKSEAPRRVTGSEKIGNRNYYVLESRAGNKSERLYFEVQSGLLYKVRTEIETRLGTGVEEKTFEDYRDLNGIKFPYLITNHYMEDQSQFKISEVQTNIDIHPAKFEPPASKQP